MSYHKARSGAGWLAFVPGGANPSPVHVAEIESFKLDVDQTEVELEDENGEAIDSFSSGRKITGAVSMKSFSSALLAIATDGVSLATDRPIGYSDTYVVPATPYQHTVPLTNPTRLFVAELGLIDLTAGKPMTRGATATGAGVYAIDTATGQITHHSADVGHTILANFSAKQTGEGQIASVGSASGITQSKYAIHFFGGRHAAHGIYIPQARIPGLSVAFTKGQWSSVDLKWTATKDSNGKFFHTYLPE